jgi:hypothetical protein
MQIRYGSEKITNFLKWNKNNGITAASIVHSYVDIWFSRFIETNPVPVPRKTCSRILRKGSGERELNGNTAVLGIGKQ